MDCLVCRRAETQPNTTSITLERGAVSLVFTDVPARVCPNCGESYVDEAVAAALLASGEKIVEAGVLTATRRYGEDA
jgi:YgiT-type zinc finger domain-containing protein